MPAAAPQPVDAAGASANDSATATVASTAMNDALTSTATKDALTVTDTNDALNTALRALADGNRRAILALVREHPLAVGDIAARVDVTQQGVSHHLAVLKRAGLVAETRDGTRHLFAVRTDGLAAVRSYLDDFWPTQLAALKKAVEDAANG